MTLEPNCRFEAGGIGRASVPTAAFRLLRTLPGLAPRRGPSWLTDYKVFFPLVKSPAHPDLYFFSVGTHLPGGRQVRPQDLPFPYMG